MSRTLTTMQDRVADIIKDTDSTMKTIIGRFLNKRYFQVFRAINWEVYNDDYTITTTGVQDYVLPTDFKTEVYAVDTTNGTELARCEMQDLAKDYPDAISDSGTTKRYVIFTDDSGNRKIRLHYVPSSVIVIALPYIIKPTILTTADAPKLTDCEDLLETGALSDAWGYKQQLGKAQYFEAMFNKELAEYIWEQENQMNKISQLKPEVYNQDNLY